MQKRLLILAAVFILPVFLNAQGGALVTAQKAGKIVKAGRTAGAAKTGGVIILTSMINTSGAAQNIAARAAEAIEKSGDAVLSGIKNEAEAASARIDAAKERLKIFGEKNVDLFDSAIAKEAYYSWEKELLNIEKDMAAIAEKAAIFQQNPKTHASEITVLREELAGVLKRLEKQYKIVMELPETIEEYYMTIF
jgi:hypothetical protein